MRNIVVVQDLSCFGKCSLTIALPVLSTSGLSVSVMPTALLSTHTAYPDPYQLDLSKQMHQIQKHWQSLSLKFDAIYSGYLSSASQMQEVQHLHKTYPDAYFMVDPVMGDHGTIYRSLPQEIPKLMQDLILDADLITPNMTEAYALLDEPYQSGPYTEAEITRLLWALSKKTKASIVLTGVYLEETSIGVAIFDQGNSDMIVYPKYKKNYHGTGDLFASVLLALLAQQKTLVQAASQAAQFVGSCIAYSMEKPIDPKEGICFEPMLAHFFHERISQ